MKQKLLLFLIALLASFGVAFAQSQSSTLVADCESGNLTKLKTQWSSYADGAGATITPGTPFTMAQGGANGTAYAASVSGKLGVTGDPDYSTAGISFNLTTTNEILDTTKKVTNPNACALDLTGATGVGFWHKGDAITFNVMITSVTANSGYDYQISIPTSTTWQYVVVAFPGSTPAVVGDFEGTLAQASWVASTEQKAWNSALVYKLQWQVKDGAEGRNYQFAIDEISILGKDVAVEGSDVESGETVVIPWNQWSKDPDVYQLIDGSKLANYILPQLGDVVTIHVAGTADENIDGFKLFIIDDREIAGYFEPFADGESGLIGDFAAGEAFDATFEFPIISIFKDSLRLIEPKIAFFGKNAALAGNDGTGTAITLSLTAYEVDVTPAEAEITPNPIAGNLGNYVFGTQQDAIDPNYQQAYWSLSQNNVALAQTAGTKLVFELSTNPINAENAAMQLIWQSPENELWWQSTDIFYSVGTITNGSTWDAKTGTLTIDLETVLPDYASFIEQPSVNFILAYYGAENINDLGIISANLVAPAFDGETVIVPWNEYGKTLDVYQLIDGSKLANYILPQLGDVVTIHVAGTADENIDEFQLFIIDDREDAGWFEPFAKSELIGDFAAGKTFDATLEFTITDIFKDSLRLIEPKIAFFGKNAALAGNDGTGTAITLMLTAYEVEVTPAVIVLTCTDPQAINFGKEEECRYSQTPQFSAIPDITEFNEKGGYTYVTISSNVDWVADVVGSSAISVDTQQESAGTASMIVAIEQNTTPNTRTFIIIFRNGNIGLDTLIFTQTGTTVPEITPNPVKGNMGNYTFGTPETPDYQHALWSLSGENLALAKTAGTELVFNFSTNPVNAENSAMQLVWQSPENELWWQPTDIFYSTGAITNGSTWDAKTGTLTMDLKTVLKDYESFKEQPSAKFILVYYGAENINDLGIVSANIVAPTFNGETVVMPWNQWSEYPDVYQLIDGSKLANYILPQLGDVVTVHVAGSTNEDITGFKLFILDDREIAGYFEPFADFGEIGNITAGEPFDATFEFSVTSIFKDTLRLIEPKVAFLGTNAALAGNDGTGTAITLALTAYEVSVTPAVIVPTCTDPQAINFGKEEECQYAQTPQFSAIPDVTEFNEKGGYTNVVITSNVNWVADAIGNGISISPQQGGAVPTTGTISVEQNTTPNTRTFQIVFRNGNIGLDTLMFTQTGAAIIDDVYGCMDSTALNYNPKATQQTANTPCEYAVYGCTDPEAINYSPNANTDNKSCEYAFITATADITSFGAEGGNASITVTSNVPWIAGVTSQTMQPYISITPNTVSAPAPQGIQGTITLQPNTTTAARTFTIIFRSTANNTVLDTLILTQSAKTETVVYGCMDEKAGNYNPKATAQSANTPCVYYGCMDKTAINYDPQATEQTPNTPCKYNVYGCMDEKATNYNPLATISNNSCKFGQTQVVYGCTDTTATNYNKNATRDDQSCKYATEVSGCTNPQALNYKQNASKDDGSCVFPIYGCTNPEASNYNPKATVQTPNTPCKFDVYGCTDETAENYYAKATIDNGTCYYAEIAGCMSPNASNYNANATVEDGSCTFTQKIWGCTDKNAKNYSANANADDGRCEYVTIVYGCTDRSALNFEPAANHNDNSCEYAKNSVYGCMNPAALNYNPYATIANNSCVFNTIAQNTVTQNTVEGCTDTLALNFNVVATKDDGRCVYKATEVAGCMQHMALNFNEKATVDDNSCVFANPENINMFASEEEAAKAAAGAQVFSNVVKNACNFDFNTPIDTAYIAHLKKLTNGTYKATWIIVQGDDVNAIQTVYSEKAENAMYYLSLICNTAAGWLKANDEVRAITIGALFKGDEPIIGCMDETAKNYNEDATENDASSCIYTAINAVEGTDIVVYPNPTAGMVYVSAASEIKVYNSFGALVIATHGTQVDLSNFANGVYVVQVNGKRTTVVKND